MKNYGIIIHKWRWDMNNKSDDYLDNLTSKGLLIEDKIFLFIGKGLARFILPALIVMVMVVSFQKGVYWRDSEFLKLYKNKGGVVLKSSRSEIRIDGVMNRDEKSRVKLYNHGEVALEMEVIYVDKYNWKEGVKEIYEISKGDKNGIFKGEYVLMNLDNASKRDITFMENSSKFAHMEEYFELAKLTMISKSDMRSRLDLKSVVIPLGVIILGYLFFYKSKLVYDIDHILCKSKQEIGEDYRFVCKIIGVLLVASGIFLFIKMKNSNEWINMIYYIVTKS